MDAHGEAVKVGLRVSVVSCHCGQTPTGNTQKAEREAVKEKAMN